MQKGRGFDANYVWRLSDDAVPALLEAMPTFAFDEQCVVKNKLLNRLEIARMEKDFRLWNWARQTARNKTSQQAESLNIVGCPENTRGYYDDY